MSSYIKVLVFICLGCLSISLSAKQKNVLVIHSYHQGFNWTDSVNQGIIKKINSVDASVELYFEYLDMKRNLSAEYLSLMSDVFKVKSRYRDYNVIIVSDNKALNFILANRSAFYPGIPIVFCGINGYNNDLLLGEKNITGVTENSDEEGNIQLIMDLFPRIKNLYIINDNRTTTSKIVHQNLKQIEKKYIGRLKFSYWQDFSLSELNHKILSLRPDSDVLFVTNYNIDKSDEFVTIEDLKKVLKSNRFIPVFGNRFFINHNLSIGGKLEDALGQGETAAEIALEILNGVPADSIPIQKKGLGKYFFSHEKLKEFGINKSSLPKNSIILRKSDSIFNVDKKIIITGSLIFIFLVLVIIVLSFVVRQKQRIEELLKQEKAILHENLELQNVHSKLVTLFNRTNDFRLVIDDVLAELINFYKFDRISLFSVVEEEKIEFNKIVSGGRETEELKYEHFLKLERLRKLVRKNGFCIIENFNELTAEEIEIFTSYNIYSMCILYMQLGGNKLGYVVFIMNKSFRWPEKLIKELIIFCGLLSAAWERYLQMNKLLTAEKENVKATQIIEKAARISTIGVVASGITHEINQPLNALRVTVDSIKYWKKHNNVQIPDFISNKLETLSKGIIRIDEIVRYMRNFWISPDISDSKTQISLNDTISTACDFVKSKLSEQNIGFSLILLPADIYIYINRTQLEQIVVNLIINAVQAFKKTDKESKAICIKLERKDGQVLIIVRDNALGIDPLVGVNLFDPFYSTKIKDEGMGLGLALVKSFVDKMCGTVHYENNDVGGVDFIITLEIKN